MNVKQHIRMTASELAMGRYMRAPDHSSTDFDTAFATFASPEEKKPGEAGAAGATGGDAAAGGEGDGVGAGAAAGDGSGGAAGDSGDGSGAAAEGAADAGAGGGDQAAAAGADGAAAAAGDGKGGDGAGAGADAAAGADAGAGAAAVDADKPTGADAAAGAAPDADAILAGLKKLVGQPEAGAASGDGAAAAAPAEDKPIYTADEQAKLAKYEEDWKDVSEGEALKRRAEYQQLLQHIFTQVANFVKPIQETADVLAHRTFTGDVRAAVPDYSDQLRADVVTWVKSQPTYLQVAYNHVIEEGTVDEVKDLVERYRTATGKAAPKPAGAGGAAPKADDKGNELSDEANKAALALAPVDSKRSGVQAPSDPSNFEDAWKQAATDLD